MSTAPAITEKRRDTRRELDLAGSMVDGGRRYHLQMINVSAGGTLVHVSHCPEVDSTTLLLIPFDVKGESHHVALHVRVAHVRKLPDDEMFEMGLEWVRAECRNRPDALQYFARTVVPGARGVLRGVGKAGAQRFVFFFHRNLEQATDASVGAERGDTTVTVSPVRKAAGASAQKPRVRVRVKTGLPESPPPDARPAERSLQGEHEQTQVTPAPVMGEEAMDTQVQAQGVHVAPAVSTVGLASVAPAVASTQSPHSVFLSPPKKGSASAPMSAPLPSMVIPRSVTRSTAVIPVQQSGDRRRMSDRTVVLRRVLVRVGGTDRAAYITDISAHGAFIQIDSHLPAVGDAVVVKFGRGARGVAVNANVIHCMDPDQSGLVGSGFGVHFVFDSSNPYRCSEQRQAITKLV